MYATESPSSDLNNLSKIGTFDSAAFFTQDFLYQARRALERVPGAYKRVCDQTSDENLKAIFSAKSLTQDF